ncbi:MAG: EthD family reductase [Streptosporangiaceae bacterium]
MTVKLVVLYTRPDDADAFEQHYAGTHMPLVDQIPGLQRTETGLVGAAADGGEKTFYRITELYFADPDALQAGFGSDEGKATAADYQKIAPAGSRMFVVPVDD